MFALSKARSATGQPDQYPLSMFSYCWYGSCRLKGALLTTVGFEQLIISSTAFQGVDLLHMSKSAKLMGK